MPTLLLLQRDHFVDSTSNKKPTLTILDKEDDPIAEGVTVQVDAPMPQPFRDSLLDNRLTDSCWSVESTQIYRAQMESSHPGGS